MIRHEITTREEYDYAVKRGYEPLVDKRFPMPISLRRQIQREKFGKNDMEGNEKFYRYCWDARAKVLFGGEHICENCMRPLGDYQAIHISHILTKGAHQDMSHDPRNVNLFCGQCHSIWEQATTRKGMRIYEQNLHTIENLKKDYQNK